MKISKKKIELKDSLEKEWIITNGLGGFCSTTVVIIHSFSKQSFNSIF